MLPTLVIALMVVVVIVILILGNWDKFVDGWKRGWKKNRR